MTLERSGRWCRGVLLLGLVSCLLVACSSKKVNQPKELDSQFKNQIHVKRLWKKSVGVGDQGLKLDLSPVYRDGKIYTVDIEGEIIALDSSNGKAVWRHRIKDRVLGGLAIDRFNLYLTTFSGYLVSLDIMSGEEKWRAPLTSEVTAVPAVNGELVIVQSIDGKVSAFDVESGKQRWRYDSVVPILSLRGTAKPLVSRKYTVSSFANGEIIMLSNEAGRPLWKTTLALPKGRTELERLVDSDGQAVLDGDTLYAAAYQGKVFSLSALDGQENWSKEISSFNQLATGFGKLFITTDKGEVIALDKLSGKELWRNDEFLHRRLGAPIVFDQYVMASDFEGYLHVLSVLDGKTLARKKPDSLGVMGNMIIKGDQLFVYTRSGDMVTYTLNPDIAKGVSRGPKILSRRSSGETSFEFVD